MIPGFNPETYLADKKNRRNFGRAIIVDVDGGMADTVIPYPNPLNPSEMGWALGSPADGEIGNYRQADGTVLSKGTRFAWMPHHPLELQYLTGDGSPNYTGDMEIHTFNGPSQHGPYAPLQHIDTYSIDLDAMKQSSAGFAWDREPNPGYSGEWDVNWYMQYWWVDPQYFRFGQVQMFWQYQRDSNRAAGETILAIHFPTR